MREHLPYIFNVYGIKGKLLFVNICFSEISGRGRYAENDDDNVDKFG